MPRTYYEWLDARRKWLKGQNDRVAKIPYPGIDSVVYSRSSNNPFWERRRQNALSQIPSSLTFSFEDTRIESFIRTAAL